MPKTSLQWSEAESLDESQQSLINESNETSSLLNTNENDNSSSNNYQSIVSLHEQNVNRKKDIKDMTSWEQMRTKEYM